MQGAAKDQYPVMGSHQDSSSPPPTASLEGRATVVTLLLWPQPLRVSAMTKRAGKERPGVYSEKGARFSMIAVVLHVIRI